MILKIIYSETGKKEIVDLYDGFDRLVHERVTLDFARRMCDQEAGKINQFRMAHFLTAKGADDSEPKTAEEFLLQNGQQDERTDRRVYVWCSGLYSAYILNDNGKTVETIIKWTVD